MGTAGRSTLAGAYCSSARCSGAAREAELCASAPMPPGVGVAGSYLEKIRVFKAGSTLPE